MGKKRNESSSSSSEDDVISSQLRECVTGFELQKKDVVKEVEKITIKFQNSKRSDKNNAVTDEDGDENTHVTPEFQEFVGKKLRAKLDDLIELVEVENKQKKKKKKKKRSRESERSIDELHSENFLFFKGVFFNKDQLENLEDTKYAKKSKKSNKSKNEFSSEDDEETMKKLKECAVEPTNLSRSNTDKACLKNKPDENEIIQVHSKKKKHSKKKRDSSSDEEDAETMRMLSEAAVQPKKLFESSSIKDHKNLVK